MSTSTVTWVSVKERLPKLFVPFLGCCSDGSMFIRQRVWDGDTLGKFMYWAELPEPPKEEEKIPHPYLARYLDAVEIDVRKRLKESHPKDELPLCNSFVEEYMKRHYEHQLGLQKKSIIVGFGFTPLKAAVELDASCESIALSEMPKAECDMLATSPEAVACMVGVCPDCNGTRVYRGLLEEKPCPTCCKGENT